MLAMLSLVWPYEKHLLDRIHNNLFLSIAFHGSDFMGERLTVQFARGTRSRDAFANNNNERTAPRPRRTAYRMDITGLPGETSWQVCLPRSFIRTLGSHILLFGH
jgi:hypothetical protein